MIGYELNQIFKTEFPIMNPKQENINKCSNKKDYKKRKKEKIVTIRKYGR